MSISQPSIYLQLHENNNNNNNYNNNNNNKKIIKIKKIKKIIINPFFSLKKPKKA